MEELKHLLYYTILAKFSKNGSTVYMITLNAPRPTDFTRFTGKSIKVKTNEICNI